MTAVNEIIRAVADVENTEPEDLDIALQNHIDTDAIQALADHESDSWVLQFELPNHTVRVTGDGHIFVDGTQARTFA